MGIFLYRCISIKQYMHKFGYLLINNIKIEIYYGDNLDTKKII